MGFFNKSSDPPEVSWPKRNTVYAFTSGFDLIETIAWNIITLHWMVGDQLSEMNQHLATQNDLLSRLLEKQNHSPEEPPIEKTEVEENMMDYD